MVIVRSVTLGWFIGRVPFTEGFLSSGYQLGFSALLISLEFFPHTCNNSSKVVNDVLMVLCFGNYCLGIIVNDHARHLRKFRGISSSLDSFFFFN
jgi:transposase-like protein